ncbi:MAG: AMP-binding protein [Bacteroidales bacterium]|nr:AMP-binding protein [Bacteroidales bacterium]
MKSTYSDIRLNGIFYKRQSLLKLFSDKGWFGSVEPATTQVLKFAGEWLDDRDYITLLTSGTTGNPKKIRLLKDSMVRSAMLTQHFFSLDDSKNALLCLPTGYIAGIMMIVRAFVTGYNLITAPPSANPLENIRQSVDFTALTPYQLYHSLGDIRRLNIRQIIVGGGEIPAELEKKIMNIPSDIYATYGMTETCSHVALRKLNGTDAADNYTALEGISFLQDQRQCLVIDAPMLSVKKIFTSDVVELIDNKHFRWLGRCDNVINTGGIKVYPEAVEKKIHGLFNRPFFISSVKDSKLSEKLIIVVEGEHLTKEQEYRLLKQFRARLGRYEHPKEFLYIKRFRYTRSGKILRKESLEKIKED